MSSTSIFIIQKKTIVKEILTWLVIFSSLTFFLKVILENHGLDAISYAKDLILCFLIIIALKKLSTNRLISLKVSPFLILIVVFIVLSIPYCIISPLNLGDKIKLWWALIFGPLLYLTMTMLKIEHNTTTLAMKGIFIWIVFITSSAILIYMIGQDLVFRAIGFFSYVKSHGGLEQTVVLYRSMGSYRITRMAGVFFTPLDMAFTVIFQIGLGFIVLKNKKLLFLNILISLFGLYLCHNRSVLVGVIAAVFLLWWAERKLFAKIVTSTMFTVLLFAGIMYGYSKVRNVESYLIGTVGGSAAASGLLHLNHLLIRGPELAMKNWHGAGIGMTSSRIMWNNQPENFIGNIESFYYALSIQMGFHGLLVYLLIVYVVLNKILKDKKLVKTVLGTRKYDIIFNVSFILIASVHLGVIFLPVLDSKIIQSVLWITIFYILNFKKFLLKGADVNGVSCLS
jgi:hypothetical protein